MDQKRIGMIFAGVVIILLLGFLGYALWPYINAFLGAFILYVLFKPVYNKLIEKGFKEKTSSFIAIILSIFIVIIPAIFIFSLIVEQAVSLIQNKDLLLNGVSFIENLLNLSIKDSVLSNLSQLTSIVTGFSIGFLKSLGKMIIIGFMMYFTLFYLLIYDRKILESLRPFIPFNKKNTHKLIEEFKNITYTTIVVSGIIGLVQGSLLSLSFFLFGVSGVILWGFIAALLSFLGVLGPPLIWIPTVLLQFFDKNYLAGFGILGFGIFLSNMDNLIRPYLQKRVGNIHPLTSLVGVFIGIPIFGILGVIIGPLLISYVLLTIKMYKEEYFEKGFN